MVMVSAARRSENRRNGLRVHRSRFAWRLFWPLAAMAVTFTPVLAAAGYPPAKSIASAATAVLLTISPLAPALAMPALQIAAILYLALYMFATDVRWKLEKSAVRQSAPRKTAEGYLDAVETMNGASYTGNLTAMFGALAIFSAFSSVALQDWAAWVQIVLGLAICWLGYKVSHRYVSGPVFAPEILIRTEMSGPEGISRTAAASRVQGPSLTLEAARPHCFHHSPRGGRKPRRPG